MYFNFLFFFFSIFLLFVLFLACTFYGMTIVSLVFCAFVEAAFLCHNLLATVWKTWKHKSLKISSRFRKFDFLELNKNWNKKKLENRVVEYKQKQPHQRERDFGGFILCLVSTTSTQKVMGMDRQLVFLLFFIFGNNNWYQVS